MPFASQTGPAAAIARPRSAGPRARAYLEVLVETSRVGVAVLDVRAGPSPCSITRRPRDRGNDPAGHLLLFFSLSLVEPPGDLTGLFR